MTLLIQASFSKWKGEWNDAVQAQKQRFGSEVLCPSLFGTVQLLCGQARRGDPKDTFSLMSIETLAPYWKKGGDGEALHDRPVLCIEMKLWIKEWHTQEFSEWSNDCVDVSFEKTQKVFCHWQSIAYWRVCKMESVSVHTAKKQNLEPGSNACQLLQRGLTFAGARHVGWPQKYFVIYTTWNPVLYSRSICKMEVGQGWQHFVQI